jgi:hypothetical protein
VLNISSDGRSIGGRRLPTEQLIRYRAGTDGPRTLRTIEMLDGSDATEHLAQTNL